MTQVVALHLTYTSENDAAIYVTYITLRLRYHNPAFKSGNIKQ